MIVEYAPNQFAGPPAFDGTIEDTHLGFYQSGGDGFIWATMPFIDDKGTPANRDDDAIDRRWWGTGATDTAGALLAAEYTKAALVDIIESYGGDHSKVFVTGFSRGAIAAGAVGLINESMADIWLGFLPHSHHDGFGFGLNTSRLSRIKGRASFITYGETDGGRVNSIAAATYLRETLGFPVESRELLGETHTDEWIMDTASASSLALRRDLRDWLADTISNHPGTHSISGQVVDVHGRPLIGVRIQSGDTHWTFTDASGNYELAGLIDGSRNLTASHETIDFKHPTISATLRGTDLTGYNFEAVPEPSTAILCYLGALGMALWTAKRRKRRSPCSVQRLSK